MGQINTGDSTLDTSKPEETRLASCRILETTGGPNG